jgi:hypothetical protein
MNKQPQQLYQDALVWDAHAGVFPGPDVDLNLLDDGKISRLQVGGIATRVLLGEIFL